MITQVDMGFLRDRLEDALEETIGFKAHSAGVQVVNPPEADLAGTVDGKEVRVKLSIAGLDYA